MAISATNLTFGNTSVAQSSAATASVSPNTNSLTIVAATGSLGVAPTVSGASGTWVLIGSQLDSGGLRVVSLFRDLSPSPGSGALTIDFGGVNQNFIGWSVDQLSGVDESGAHGSGAIVQFTGAGTASGATAGITVNLAAFGSAINAAYGFVRNNAINTISSVSGLAVLSQNDPGELNAEWGLNKTAVGWTWTSQTVTTVAMAIEIKAAPPFNPPYGSTRVVAWY